MEKNSLMNLVDDFFAAENVRNVEKKADQKLFNIAKLVCPDFEIDFTTLQCFWLSSTNLLISIIRSRLRRCGEVSKASRDIRFGWRKKHNEKLIH